MFDWVLNTSLLFNTFVGDAPFLDTLRDLVPFLQFKKRPLMGQQRY